MARARFWTCRGCKTRNPRIKQRCVCGRKRPAARTAAQKALTDPYAVWVERFGDQCNICGRKASARRRLDRDHCHRSLEPRGLLCARCNRALLAWVDADWLEKAAAYLRRASEGGPTISP